MTTWPSVGHTHRCGLLSVLWDFYQHRLQAVNAVRGDNC